MARSRAAFARLEVPPGVAPMEAKLVDALPAGAGWQFEPKWDGFRCLAFRDGADVALYAKSGKPLTRYFPEMVAALQALPVARFVLDGELAIPIGETLSFDALQMRLHPAASRIRRLAAETPAIFILFDCLAAADGKSRLAAPLTARRAALDELHRSFAGAASLRLSPYTRDRRQARRWLEKGGGLLDGVVAKRADGPYVVGERAMLKVKCLRHRRLRGRRLPLRAGHAAGWLAAARPLQRRRLARPCRLHRDDHQGAAPGPDEEAGGVGGRCRLHR